jgi:hypothetical protein
VRLNLVRTGNTIKPATFLSLLLGKAYMVHVGIAELSVQLNVAVEATIIDT